MSGFVCECGWRCEQPGCWVPPEDHDCMWCGADGPTRWNGEEVRCERVIVVVADDPDIPEYWAREFVGQERHAVEVRYGGHTFYIDNEDGSGWAKVRFSGGSPRVGHADLRIARVVATPQPTSNTEREGEPDA